MQCTCDGCAELQGLPNVILTPHIGGSTEEAQAAIGKEVASSLIRFVNRGTSTGAVNFPHVCSQSVHNFVQSRSAASVDIDGA